MRLAWTRDEVILACDLVMANGWKALDGGRPEVIDLSHLLNRAPLHPVALRSPTFRNPNGVGRKTADLATRHPEYKGIPTNGSWLDREVLADFIAAPDHMSNVATAIRLCIERGDVKHMPDELTDMDGTEAKEGRLLLVSYLRRERNPNLRRRKIAEARRRGRSVACEVCGFDFALTYGHRGNGYIEVHHAVPLHISGMVTTRLSDLVLLCANCHRMIHRGSWITPTELLAVLQS